MAIWRIALITGIVVFGTTANAQDFGATEPAAWDEPHGESLVPPPEPVPWVPNSAAPGSPAMAPAFPPANWQPIDPAYVPVTVLPPPPPPESANVSWPVSSTWYLRADYFHWNERIDGFDLLNEDGVLTTLGYERRLDRQRFLVELFGGDVHYSGAAMFDDGTVESLSSHTEYLGARAEYDLRFAIDYWPRTCFFAGLGTRAWLRNLPNTTTPSGAFIEGYHETWWTIYPYLGMEWSRPLGGRTAVYGSARIGVTAFTYEFATVNDVKLYPNPGLTTQLEYGIRGSDLFLAGYLEVMGWGESPISQGWLQPDSTMLTAGIKAGLVY